MKFSCEHCRTSYSISDEKIRNKILTIRCRRCQSVIVVRDPDAREDSQSGVRPAPAAPSAAPGSPPPAPKFRAGSVPTADSPGDRRLGFDAGDDELDRALDRIGGGVSPPPPPAPSATKQQANRDTVITVVPANRMLEPPRAVAPSAPPPPAQAAEWFLGVSGEQRGPFSLDAVRDLFSGGLVKADALVWKAGMDNWTPAPQVDALKDVVQPVTPPPPPDKASHSAPVAAPAPDASATPSEQPLPARSPLRIAKPIDPNYYDVGESGGTMMLDAGAILSIEEIPRRRRPSKARVAITATLGIIGVSGAIVGLMVAVGAIDLFGSEASVASQERKNELLHVEGAGPLVFRDTKIIEIIKEARRRGGGRETASAAPLTGTPIPTARTAADMNTTMRLGNSGGPLGTEPSAEMRRLLTTSSGLVESGPIERPVALARKQKDEPSADDAQRFQKLFTSNYKRSVTGCYNKALKVDSSLQGSIVLTMELNERSKIRTLGMSRFQGSQFESCVKESSRSWKFAGVSPGTTIEYTINLARTE